MFEPDETWNDATPQDIPSPTYWPVTLALGIALIYWGFLSIFFISILGLVVFIMGLAGWISELQKEITHTNEKKSSHES